MCPPQGFSAAPPVMFCVALPARLLCSCNFSSFFPCFSSSFPPYSHYVLLVFCLRTTSFGSWFPLSGIVQCGTFPFFQIVGGLSSFVSQRSLSERDVWFFSASSVFSVETTSINKDGFFVPFSSHEFEHAVVNPSQGRDFGSPVFSFDTFRVVPAGDF